MSDNLITKSGLRALREQIEKISIQLQDIAVEITQAADLGDKKENNEYKVAVGKKKVIAHTLKRLISFVREAQVVDVQKIANKNKVYFGAVIDIMNEATNLTRTVRIVSNIEEDLCLDNSEEQFIGISHPVTKLLIGKKVGDVVDCPTEQVRIVKIRYDEA